MINSCLDDYFFRKTLPYCVHADLTLHCPQPVGKGERVLLNPATTDGFMPGPGLAVDRLGGEDLACRSSAPARPFHAGSVISMHEINVQAALEKISQRDPRFNREAYLFVREALNYTQKMIIKANKNKVRHVTGVELLAGIRDYALHEYGPMAHYILREWGVVSCEDFGRIVFNMVDASLLAKTENDTEADFKGVYDFEEAFRQPFLPSAKGQKPQTTSRE
jgi:uncharacterized repeat protein (TIGR04138 family)